MARTLFHLALRRDWDAAVEVDEYTISTLGRSLEEEGFIHASFANQVDGVARRFYREVTEPLVLLTIDLTLLDCEVRLEVPPGAADAFPHLYGPLPTTAVTSVEPYELSAGPGARLHHAHIFASDIEMTISFYREWFDARVIADEVLLGSRNVMVALGDGRLNIYDQAPRSTERGGIHHLGIQIRDLPALVRRMESNGYEFRKPILEGEGFRYVMVEAPDGILLELFEARDDAMPTDAAAWFAWE